MTFVNGDWSVFDLWVRLGRSVLLVGYVNVVNDSFYGSPFSKGVFIFVRGLRVFGLRFRGLRFRHCPWVPAVDRPMNENHIANHLSLTLFTD